MRSLDEVRDRVKLTSNQKIGTQYFDEFDERMQREEVTRIENVVNTQCFSLQESGRGEARNFHLCFSNVCPLVLSHFLNELCDLHLDFSLGLVLPGFDWKFYRHNLILSVDFVSVWCRSLQYLCNPKCSDFVSLVCIKLAKRYTGPKGCSLSLVVTIF